MTMSLPTASDSVPPAAALSNTSRTSFGQVPDVLVDIYNPDVNMSVWQRQLSPELIEECRALLDKQVFTAQSLTLNSSQLNQLDDLLPEFAFYSQLNEDIKLLTEMFSCLFELKFIGLRLTVLTGSMCPKFHVDWVPCRLVTTYCGVGTEWLPHENVDRSKLGTGSGGKSDAESGLYNSPKVIQTLNCGDVALLKGESWQGNEGCGLVHRSPAVPENQRRLLLTMDFA